MRLTVLTALLACAALAFNRHARADVIIDILEVDGNVVATLSGEFNLDATQGFDGESVGINGYLPDRGMLSMNAQRCWTYDMDVQWTSFGPGSFGTWDQSSGDAWHMFTNPVLGVPPFYRSGTPLTATATKFNTTLAQMGFAPGRYTTTLTNGNVSDRVIVIIIGNPYSLRVSGQCPGRITLDWAGAPPDSDHALLFGLDRGRFTIPRNFPCAGTVIRVVTQVRLVDPPGIFSTGPDGSGSLTAQVGTSACGAYFQLLHLDTCKTSNIARVP